MRHGIKINFSHLYGETQSSNFAKVQALDLFIMAV